MANLGPAIIMMLRPGLITTSAANERPKLLHRASSAWPRSEMTGSFLLDIFLEVVFWMD